MTDVRVTAEVLMLGTFSTKREIVFAALDKIVRNELKKEITDEKRDILEKIKIILDDSVYIVLSPIVLNNFLKENIESVEYNYKSFITVGIELVRHDKDLAISIDIRDRLSSLLSTLLSL